MTALKREELGLPPDASDAEREQKLRHIAAGMYGVTPAEMPE